MGMLKPWSRAPRPLLGTKAKLSGLYVKMHIIAMCVLAVWNHWQLQCHSIDDFVQSAIAKFGRQRIGLVAFGNDVGKFIATAKQVIARPVAEARRDDESAGIRPLLRCQVEYHLRCDCAKMAIHAKDLLGSNEKLDRLEDQRLVTVDFGALVFSYEVNIPANFVQNETTNLVQDLIWQVC